VTSQSLLHVLLVEDSAADARLFQEELRDSGADWCKLHHVETLAAAIEAVRTGRIDAVLLDLSLADAHGIETVSRMRAAAPTVPVVVLTGFDDQETALAAVKEGAQDYLIKAEVSGALLARAVRYAIERKRADESQRREETATQTAQLREQFVAVLGHDLRNPLSSISMGAGLLLKNGDLTERQLRVVARISSSADRMVRMIRDLLDFTRTRLGGGYGLTLGPCSLKEICRQVVEEMETVHQDRALTFTASTRGWGEWDADRMAQLASNLISNAIEYSLKGTPVTINLREEEEGPEVVFEINNRGEPIPANLLPVIFDPYYRVQASHSGRSGQGLGLGLYISHQIVLAHHGRIDIRSNAEEGTTFSVRLPRAGGAAPIR
jgi:sigma-B regulation protein RsbU (phosphoserine phosphatase)